MKNIRQYELIVYIKISKTVAVKETEEDCIKYCFILINIF